MQPLREQDHELVLVDGESTDGSVEQAQGLVDRLLVTSAGRARQMNAGARQAAGDILWFLHVDSRVSPDAAARIIAGLAARNSGWGRFDVRLSGGHPALRLVETMMNLRSRITGIATGDQGIFVSRQLFEASGGFADIPLMEDIDFSRRMRRYRPPLCLRERIITSSRRWERHGIARTILLMWRLRLGYFLGVSAERLQRHYQSCSSPTPGS